MTEWEHVTLRIAPETKKEWESHIETNPNAENLSHLVRLSVHREIHRDNEKDAQTPRELQQIGEVIEGINTLEDSLNGIESRLKAIEEERQITKGMRLQKQVLAVLPTPPHTDEPVQPNSWGQTAERLSARLGIDDTETVQQVLDQLSSVTKQVKSATGGKPPKTYWWKTE
ncbi:hypothetical protein [Halalkalicoccus jeotgali]|uniref:hypothetical protein n=1 Tax=Halalkalicoccus jeotgali TaxID=413810 RepID=UPI00138AD34C|nr:hypothetical protein [Halalkalicoccus jeotgali]